MPRTDHSEDIRFLSSRGSDHHMAGTAALTYALAADLLEYHDAGGVSLDSWVSARTLVERLLGHSIEENGA